MVLQALRRPRAELWGGSDSLQQPRSITAPEASDRFAPLEAHRRDSLLCTSAKGGRVCILPHGGHEGGYLDQGANARKVQEV